MHHVVIAMSMDRGLGRVHGNAKRLSFRKGNIFQNSKFNGKNTTRIEMATGKMEDRAMKCV
jgi:hypothetical protein